MLRSYWQLYRAGRRPNEISSYHSNGMHSEGKDCAAQFREQGSSWQRARSVKPPPRVVPRQRDSRYVTANAEGAELLLYRAWVRRDSDNLLTGLHDSAVH